MLVDLTSWNRLHVVLFLGSFGKLSLSRVSTLSHLPETSKVRLSGLYQGGFFQCIWTRRHDLHRDEQMRPHRSDFVL